MAPLAMGSETVAHEERRRQVAVVGSTQRVPRGAPAAASGAGSFLPPGDLGRGVAVVVLGATAVARELFPTDDPLGQDRPDRRRCARG